MEGRVRRDRGLSRGSAIVCAVGGGLLHFDPMGTELVEQAPGRLNVTISWSKDRSKRVAEALRDWMPTVAHRVDAWMSERDIEGGVRWGDDLAEQLEVSPFGILCLTPENLTSEWVLFEAGALSKARKSRVVPYLLGIRPSDVRPPLGQFNCVTADKAGTRKLLTALNGKVPGGGLEEALLDSLFTAAWPKLEAILDDIPPAPELVEPRRPEEMMVEVLDEVRAIRRKVDPSETDRALMLDMWERVKSMTAVERYAAFRAAQEAQMTPYERAVLAARRSRQTPQPITTEPIPIVVDRKKAKVAGPSENQREDPVE